MVGRVEFCKLTSPGHSEQLASTQHRMSHHGATLADFTNLDVPSVERRTVSALVF